MRDHFLTRDEYVIWISQHVNFTLIVLHLIVCMNWMWYCFSACLLIMQQTVNQQIITLKYFCWSYLVDVTQTKKLEFVLNEAIYLEHDSMAPVSFIYYYLYIKLNYKYISVSQRLFLAMLAHGSPFKTWCKQHIFMYKSHCFLQSFVYECDAKAIDSD